MILKGKSSPLIFSKLWTIFAVCFFINLLISMERNQQKQKRSKMRHFILIILLCFTGSAFSASFDCKKAFTNVEKLICSNKKLGDLDDDLVSLYRKIKMIRGKKIVLDQRSWLKKARNRCETITCLLKVYKERISEFNRITGTQLFMNMEYSYKAEVLEKEMNNILKKIQVEYKDDIFLKKLKKAQDAWILYRTALLDSYYPSENPRFEYGSVFSTCYKSKKMKITKLRIEDLKLWLKGIEEGDVCSGSVKTRR